MNTWLIIALAVLLVVAFTTSGVIEQAAGSRGTLIQLATSNPYYHGYGGYRGYGGYQYGRHPWYPAYGGYNYRWHPRYGYRRKYMYSPWGHWRHY